MSFHSLILEGIFLFILFIWALTTQSLSVIHFYKTQPWIYIGLLILLILEIFYILFRIRLIYQNYQAFLVTVNNKLVCPESPCDIPTFTVPNPPLNNLCDVMKLLTAFIKESPDIPLKLIKKFDYINPFGAISSFGALFKTKNIYWLMFRGTRSVQDMLQDLKETQSVLQASSKQQQLLQFGGQTQVDNEVDNEEILVHTGFLEIYNTIRKDIQSAITDVEMLIISGHSLGAAVATLAGLDFAQQGISTFVYSIASPRVGNIAFKDLVENTRLLHITQLVNTSDIIPTLPLSVTTNFKNPKHPYIYTHVGKLLTYDNNRQSILNNHDISNYLSFCL